MQIAVVKIPTKIAKTISTAVKTIETITVKEDWSQLEQIWVKGLVRD